MSITLGGQTHTKSIFFFFLLSSTNTIIHKDLLATLTARFTNRTRMNSILQKNDKEEKFELSMHVDINVLLYTYIHILNQHAVGET